MKVVITGSESFIGKELERHFRAKKIDWVGIDKVRTEDAPHTVMDVRSPKIGEAIPQDADALIHLAAISRDQDCRDIPYEVLDVNVMGTLNLIRAARAQRVRQFIFASSEWVYGEVANNAIQSEDQAIDATRIQSLYALSKIVGEQSLRLTCQQGLCPVTILRFGIVYGPRAGNWSAVESLFNAVKNQDVVSVGSLATARRFIHVSDIAEGILHAIGRDGFEIFNLSGNTLISLRDVIEQSAALLNRHPRIVEEKPQAISVRNPDNSRARKILGWAPIVDLRAGLESLREVANENP